MGTPNLNLTIPIGGTTPGAANNVTAGTYPYEWSINLGLIDSNCLSIPNNPAKVSNAGIVIDGNLNFGGFSITNASNATFSGNVGISGTLTCGSLTIGTLTVAASATIGTTLGIGGAISESTAATSLTLNGNAAATSGVGLVLNNLVTQTSGKIASFQNNGSEKLAVTFSGELLSTGIADATIFGSWTDIHGNLLLSFASTPAGSGPFVLGSNYQMQINSTNLTFSGSFFGTANTSSATTIKGNAAATGGIAVILDNQNTQTTGSIASFATGGSSKALVGFDGSFVSGAAKFTTATASTAVSVVGNAAAAGTGVILDNSVDVGATGYAVNVKANVGTSMFAISGRGHLIPLSATPTAPLAGAFATGYQATGAVNSISLNGSDASMVLKFTAGTSTAAIPIGTVLVTITLAQAYASTNVASLAGYGKVPSLAIENTALYAVMSAANTLQIVNATAFTPSAGAIYVFNIQTMGAGASS